MDLRTRALLAEHDARRLRREFLHDAVAQVAIAIDLAVRRLAPRILKRGGGPCRS